jgi:hypothetical protein
MTVMFARLWYANLQGVKKWGNIADRKNPPRENTRL